MTNRPMCKNIGERRKTRVNLVNLTPHDVHLYVGETKVATFPKAANPARASQSAKAVGQVIVEGHTLPIFFVTYGDLQDVPPVTDDTMYIVSVIAGQAMLAAGRTDFLIVHDTVRDDKGQIVGCRGFARL